MLAEIAEAERVAAATVQAAYERGDVDAPTPVYRRPSFNRASSQVASGASHDAGGCWVFLSCCLFVVARSVASSSGSGGGYAPHLTLTTTVSHGHTTHTPPRRALQAALVTRSEGEQLKLKVRPLSDEAAYSIEVRETASLAAPNGETDGAAANSVLGAYSPNARCAQLAWSRQFDHLVNSVSRSAPAAAAAANEAGYFIVGHSPDPYTTGTPSTLGLALGRRAARRGRRGRRARDRARLRDVVRDLLVPRLGPGVMLLWFGWNETQNARVCLGRPRRDRRAVGVARSRANARRARRGRLSWVRRPACHRDEVCSRLSTTRDGGVQWWLTHCRG